MMQWGKTSALSGGSNAGQQLSVSFPVSFPTVCVNVVASLNNTVSDNAITISSLSTSGMIVSNNASAWVYNGEIGGPVYWQAIGY